MRALWQRLTGNRVEAVSPLLGLAMASLYLAGVAGVGAAAWRVQRDELTAQRVSDARHWLDALGYRLAEDTPDPEHLRRELVELASHEGIRWAGAASPEGVWLAHSEPGLTGQRVDGMQAEAEAGAADDDRLLVAIPISRGSRVSELRVALVPPALVWQQSRVFFWCGYILMGIMGLFLLLYRWFRRAVEPLAVIRDRLVSLKENPAERLAAVRLNDSYDQVSTSWNCLIEFVGEMQEQVRKVNLNADVTGALDGYRSERLADILMQIPFGVLVIDGEKRIVFANRAATGMVGTPGEPLEQGSASAILGEELQVSLLSAPRSERGSGGAGSRWVDHVFKRAHGDIVLRFWSVGGAGGERILFVQDVTQAKEAEKARDQFLYHVTHELRTPLTNIRAYAETLSQGVIEDEQTIRECYNVIMGETQRLNRLVEDILSVSQLEVGTARLAVGEVQLDRLLRAVVQDAQGQADAKNIDLVLNLPAKAPKIRGDKERFAVVMTNLVGNAIKYTPEGGRVDVRCVCEQERVRISVTDTGIGIDPEDQEKIFDKFYRVADERVSALPGTGLGLAIARETIRVHGGQILVASTPGKGSTFTVVLAPAGDETVMDARAGDAPAERST